MNVYTNNRFTGHWPVGSAAVVVEESAEKAAARLNVDLREAELPGDALPEDMIPLWTGVPFCRILCDGEY
jgi:hypothetical protein